MTNPITITVPGDTTAPAVKPKPRTPSRLSTWTPDRRWAHPLEAAMWCYVAALVGSYDPFAIPGWVMAFPGVVAAVLGVARARRAWPVDEFGGDIGPSMAWLAAVAGIVAGAWLVFACYTSPLSAVGWLAICTAWFGGWYALLRTSAPKAAAAIVQAQKDAELAAATATWREILKATGLPLKIAETRPTRAGYVIGVEPADDSHPVSFDTLRGKLPDLTVKAAAILARSGAAVRAGDIRIEETSVAHVHLIHVCTKHVLTQTIPYEPIPEPTTIADPIDPALYEDGRLVELVFGGDLGGTNGKIVGATGSGKTVLANCIIGRVGECVDALVGVIASDKLVPLTYPWVRPWLDGRAAAPGIDFVAGQDPRRVLEMLAAVYRIVRERNDRLANAPTHVATPTAPAIVLLIEESGDMAPRRDTIVTHDGQRADFSKLLHMICKADRSAQVSLLMMNQSDLYGALGDYGPEIARNTPLRVCLKTLAPQDGMSVLPGLSASYTDTSKLRNHSMLVQPSIEDPRVMPAKSYRLDRADVHPVSIRNSGWRPALEPDIAALLGDLWSGRWDADRLPELAAAAARDGLEWPVGRPDTPEDPIDVELRKLLEAHAPTDTLAEGQAVEGGEFPDAAKGVAELNEVAGRIGTPLTLPEPLAAVVAILAEPQAPKDFISTRQLAILLGRVGGDADEAELKEAARRLGRELSAVDEDIRSVQRGKLQGYDVPALRVVAARIARGGQ